jgi:hypothetical protein
MTKHKRKPGPPKGTLPPNTRHRMTKTREYATWCRIRERCYNPQYHSYKYYGGRGIKVCERWLECFENFFEDVGPRPSVKHSLERINNNGDYSPENCQWATKIQQANNKRNIKKYEFNGELKTIANWARVVRIQKGTIFWRIRNGWSMKDALTLSPDSPQDIINGRYVSKIN